MMIFELKEKKDSVVEEMYEKAMGELGKFFKFNWKRNRPKVIVVKNRKEIDNIRGVKSERWWVGWAEEANLFILERKNYEKESNHKYSEGEYFRLIKHELCHMFFGVISQTCGYDQFRWLDEGCAVFLSGQCKEHRVPGKFERFLGQYSNWSGNSYGEAGHALRLLYENYGKEKLLGMIKSLRGVRSQKDFNTNFRKIYGSAPTYKFFNAMLKK